jgi:hypothetical protein
MSLPLLNLLCHNTTKPTVTASTKPTLACLPPELATGPMFLPHMINAIKAHGRCNGQNDAEGEDHREKLATSSKSVPFCGYVFLKDCRSFGVNKGFNFVFNLSEYSTPHLVNDKTLVYDTRTHTSENKISGKERPAELIHFSART